MKILSFILISIFIFSQTAFAGRNNCTRNILALGIEVISAPKLYEEIDLNQDEFYIHGSLNERGVLRFNFQLKKGSKRSELIYGHQAFKRMIEHFDFRIQEIHTHWHLGSDNFNFFVNEFRKSQNLMKSISATKSAKWLEDNGFELAEDVALIYKAGELQDIKGIFRRK